jgi:hypothetical protein
MINFTELIIRDVPLQVSYGKNKKENHCILCNTYDKSETKNLTKYSHIWSSFLPLCVSVLIYTSVFVTIYGKEHVKWTKYNNTTAVIVSLCSHSIIKAPYTHTPNILCPVLELCGFQIFSHTYVITCMVNINN